MRKLPEKIEVVAEPFELRGSDPLTRTAINTYVNGVQVAAKTLRKTAILDEEFDEIIDLLRIEVKKKLDEIERYDD